MALDCGMNVTEEIGRGGGGGGGGGEGRGGESIRGSGNRDALRGGRRGSRKVSLPFHRRRIPTASRRQRGSAAELMDKVRLSCGWEGIVTSPSPRGCFSRAERSGENEGGEGASASEGWGGRKAGGMMERSNLKCRLLPPEPSRVAQLSGHLVRLL